MRNQMERRLREMSAAFNLTELPITGKQSAWPMSRRSCVRLGDYEFDTKAGELRKGSKHVVLQNQPHKILLMLLEYPGEVVTRDEIQQRLWPEGTIITFEVSISQAVRKLRHALNDSAANPAYVQTVGRRGYRLIVPVKPVVEPPEPALTATILATTARCSWRCRPASLPRP